MFDSCTIDVVVKGILFWFDKVKLENGSSCYCRSKAELFLRGHKMLSINYCCSLCRPTIFIEIIQRVGCMEKEESTGREVQKGGCGGFGKGNFSELFKSIEEYEKTLDGTLKA